MSAYSRYALPSDDLAVSASSIVASAADSGYVAANLAQAYDANLTRPAKLTTQTGYWDVTISGTAVACVIVGHNLDAGLSVTVGGEAVTIPAAHADGWTINPFLVFASSKTGTVRLNIVGTNTYPVSVHRLMLLSSLRTFPADIRMGFRQDELHRDVMQETALGIETPFDLGGKERSIEGETPTQGSAATTFQELRRGVKGRVKPWLYIPDNRTNDAWYVRFVEPTGSFTYNANSYFPQRFHVREVSRGLPWP